MARHRLPPPALISPRKPICKRYRIYETVYLANLEAVQIGVLQIEAQPYWFAPQVG